MSTLDTLGVTADSLGLSQLVHHHGVGSTRDVAHSLASRLPVCWYWPIARCRAQTRGHAWVQAGAGIG
jgi:hypothetical protein